MTIKGNVILYTHKLVKIIGGDNLDIINICCAPDPHMELAAQFNFLGHACAEIVLVVERHIKEISLLMDVVSTKRKGENK